nr:retrovirus-related Pol polyprotein from transposon TNT 1-94 [Tanacetum cinerariifolium]
MKHTFIGYGSDEMGHSFRMRRVTTDEMGHFFQDAKGHKVVRSRDVTFNEDPLYRAKATTYSSNLTEPKQKDQLMLEVCPKNLAENSRVVEDGLSLENTQMSGENSNTSRGYESSGSSHSSGRSNDKDRDIDVVKAIFITLQQIQRSNKESRALQRASGCSGLKKSRMATEEDLHLEQLDVKTASLHGDLDEDIYIAQLEGFHSAGKEENHVCKLNKSLYGLKKAPRQIKDLGSVKRILGISIIKVQTVGTLRLSQEKHIRKVFDKFNMNDGEARCQPLGNQHKLNKKQAPTTEPTRRRMAKVPFALRALQGIQMAAMLLERHFKGYHLFHQKSGFLKGFSNSDYGGCLDSENPAYMFTNVVTIEKLKLCAASTRL